MCEAKFKLIRFRQTRLRTIKRDADYHHWYADGQSPIRFYAVVCPHCGYAAGEDRFNQIGEKERLLLRKHTQGIVLTEDINADRSDNGRVAACFGQAIRQAATARVSASVLAGLYLRAAWFCREIEDKDQERMMLQLACKNYETAYEKEPLPIESLTRLGLIFLLGESARRLEDFQRAAYWFGEAGRLRDELKAEPTVAKHLAQQHKQMREDYKAKQLKIQPKI